MKKRLVSSSGLRYNIVVFGWFRKKKQNTDGTPGFSVSNIPDWMISAQWGARARWLSHVIDFWGDPTEEWAPNPNMELPNRPDFLVLEFGPREGRDYWTYLSAGLAFVPQRPGGPMPHVEVVAYSTERDARVAEFLFMLAHDIATAETHDLAFKVFDLWGAEFHGLLHFMLVPARESTELLDFPNREKRKEDERYLLATTGELDGEMELNLLQLVPLTEDQWKNASERGSRSLLDGLNWSQQPKTFGWSAIRPRNAI